MAVSSRIRRSGIVAIGRIIGRAGRFRGGRAVMRWCAAAGTGCSPFIIDTEGERGIFVSCFARFLSQHYATNFPRYEFQTFPDFRTPIKHLSLESLEVCPTRRASKKTINFHFFRSLDVTNRELIFKLIRPQWIFSRRKTIFPIAFAEAEKFLSVVVVRREKFLARMFYDRCSSRDLMWRLTAQCVNTLRWKAFNSPREGSCATLWFVSSRGKCRGNPSTLGFSHAYPL